MAGLYGIVQSVIRANSVHSLAFNSPVTSGNLLVVGFKSNSSVASVGISDTLGTSYTLVNRVEGSPVSFAMWYGVAPSSGSNTVNISSYPNNFDGMIIVEVSGATATLDASTSNYAQNSIPYNSFPPTPNRLPVVTTNDGTINYGTTVSTSTPFPTPSVNQVRARWEGDFTAPTTGTYTMGINVDDSARLVIGGSVNSQGLVIGGTVVASCAGRVGGANTTPTYNYSGTIALTGGQIYHLILDYGGGTGGQEIQLLWTPPGGSVQLMPSTVWVGSTIQGKWWNEWYNFPYSNFMTVTTTQSDIFLCMGSSRGGGATVGTRWTPNFHIINEYWNADYYFLAVSSEPAGTYPCYLETWNDSNSFPAILVAFPSTVNNSVFVPAVSGCAVLEKPVNDVCVSKVTGYAVLEKPSNSVSVSEVSGYAVVVTAGSGGVAGGVELDTDLPDGSIGVTYNTTIGTITGSSPFTFQILSGGLPSGLSLNSSSGVISGTPTTANIYQFVIQATDTNNNTGTASFQITIGAGSSSAGNYGFSY